MGTKKQCQDVIRDEADRVGMPYVSHRWLGGLLTNFATIDNRIKRMHELRKLKEEGQLSLLPTKERMAMERELEKLEINLGGVSTMTRLPDAVFVADPKREAIATKEVNKLGLPLIGLVRHQLRPRRGRVPHPRQRRRHPFLQPDREDPCPGRRRRPAEDPGR